MIHTEYRYQATEYKDRKRRIRPVDYCETKRRSQVVESPEPNQSDIPLNIAVKKEKFDGLLQAINYLNEQLGPVVINDDVEIRPVIDMDNDRNDIIENGQNAQQNRLEIYLGGDLNDGAQQDHANENAIPDVIEDDDVNLGPNIEIIDHIMDNDAPQGHVNADEDAIHEVIEGDNINHGHMDAQSAISDDDFAMSRQYHLINVSKLRST